MSQLETEAKTIEVVGIPRQATEHMGRAVSAEQRVYILHSQECKNSGIDLRECPFSIALDDGIDPDVWREYEDIPVTLAIDEKFGDLVPKLEVES